MKPNGEPESLTASGIAKIANGRIKSVTLPEPLTDINGDIIFDFDRIDVQKLTGKFKRGQVAVAGIIPISDSFSLEPSKQLGIDLNGIAVKLKDKYNGNVNGKLTLPRHRSQPNFDWQCPTQSGTSLLARDIRHHHYHRPGHPARDTRTDRCQSSTAPQPPGDSGR